MDYKVEIIGVFFSFAITILFWEILIVPAGFFVASVVGIVFYLTYRYIVFGKREVICNPPSLRFKKVCLTCLVISSVLSVLFVHPIGETASFIAWDNVPALNLLRLLLSSLLALFFPGYMILSLIDKSQKLKGTEKVLFSVLISLFILPFLGCLSFAFGSNIQQLGIPSIITLNLTLLIFYIVFKRETLRVSEKVSINLNEKLLLLSLLIFMAVLMLSKYSLNLTWDYGDLDIYYGYSVSFTKDVLPLSSVGPGLNYPFWPFIFLAECFVLSGVPYVNAFQFVSIPLTFLPILAFYTMNMAFFGKSRHKKIPIIATVFGFFSGGFGWLFRTQPFSHDQTIQSLYELFHIMARTNSGHVIPGLYPAGMYALYIYALTSIFALIWLVYSKRAILIGNLRYILISIMIALGYLAHIAETVFFIFIFLTSVLIFKRENTSLYRKCAVSIIFGLILVALPDIILGGSYYTEGNLFTYYGFSLYYGAFGLPILAFFLSFVKGYLKAPAINLKISHSNKIRALKVVCSSFVIFFYGLSFIIWSKVFVTYTYIPTQMHTVPWYAWANRLGMCGLIALVGLIYLIHRDKNVNMYPFFALLVPVSFIIARVLHVYPFYNEDSLTFFIMIPTIILASYVLLKLDQSLKKLIQTNSKNVILGLVLTFILATGFLPALLTFEATDLNYWSQGKKLSNSELDALNFLKLNTPSNGSVLTLTMRSNRLLSYAGLFQAQTYVNRDPSVILAPSFPETAIFSLTQSQLKYVYLTPADEKELKQNPIYSGFVTSYLLKYLPIAFQNSEVTIYEIPHFSIPTNSSTALVTPPLYTGYFKDIFDETYDEHCSSCSILTAGDIITVKTDNQSKNHDFGLPVNINPDEHPYAIIRWKTDGSKLLFYLVISDDIYSVSLGRSTSWQTTVINLRHFYDPGRNKTTRVEPDKQIVSVLFRNFEKDSEYSIDYIQFAGFSNNDAVGGFFPLSTVALAEIEYSTVLKDDPARFHYSTLILTHDLNVWSKTEEQDFQRYLQWVDQGGHLIVLDSLGTYPSLTHSGFANLLSLNTEGTLETDGFESQTRSLNFPSMITVPKIHSSNPNTRIIANYTRNNKPVSPYAITKKIGKGELLYLVASPYFSAIENSTSDIKRNFFRDMGSLLNVLDLKLDKNSLKRTNIFPQFDFIKEPVSLTGKVSVDTDYIQLPKLNVSRIKILSNNGSIKTIKLNDSTIEKVEYAYPVEFGINASEVHLSGIGLGRYLDIEIIGDFNLTIEIAKNNTVRMSIWNGTTLLNKTFQEATVQLNIKNNHKTFVLVKNPSITTESHTFFNRARIYRNYYKMPLFYNDGTNPFEVIGKTTFEIEYSDGGINFVDNFTYNGRWFYPTTEQEYSSFTEADIPWFDVLTSPLHFLLVTSIIVCIFLAKAKYIKTKTKIKINKQSVMRNLEGDK